MRMVFLFILIVTLPGCARAASGASLSEGFLPGDTTECIAYYPQEGLCLADRGEVNRRMQGRLPDSLPADQAARKDLFANLRSSILAEVTEPAFLAAQARKAPVRRHIQGEAEQERLNWQAASKMSVPDSVLRRLYDRYAEALFRLQADARLEILAATDSAFIDSLGTALREGKRSAPWIPGSLPLDGVPRELRDKAKTSTPGKWQAPIRMPYGFVLIRLAKKGDQARPTLEEAAPALAVLASQPVPQEISEKRVRQYYASHRDEFVRPDTIRLDADLRPRSTRHAAYAPMARRMVEAGSLPAEARGASGMFSALRPGDTLAPLGNAWGRWRFRVGEIRRGRDTIPFAEAAGRIRAELGEHDEESALRAAQEQVAAKGFDKERTVFRTALEEAYAPSTALLDSIASAADPENLGAYGPADRPEERITQFKDMERRQRARQAVDSLHAVWIRANIR